MSDAEVEVTFTFCGGNASPEDEHLLADIVAAVMRSWCGFRGDTDCKLQRFKQVRSLAMLTAMSHARRLVYRRSGSGTAG
jgi:hypothetical protein